MILITRMVLLANRHHHPLHISTQEEAWIAHPFFQVGHARQSNGHDCGVWVVCMIGAILRGYGDIALDETDVAEVRRVFANHLLTLPYTTPRSRQD